jgi:hypothetical protein
MRLLNSATVKLQEFPDDRIPKYAILSHRWQDDEVSFQDMQSDSATEKAGYAKLKMCCRQAAKDQFNYIWVDTCCIDKTSSAELSESINSMYRWYQNAAICYAYLFDVSSISVSDDTNFADSTWFTRGWTLQELIAPSIVEFYNADWQKLGTKHEMMDTISQITKIDVGVLGGVDPECFSIAKRMSWASRRTTTRVEDIAYSLLGLFAVHMPMLYGEGEKAFIRLQEEIIKHSDDSSIFAWSNTDDEPRGLLAKSPADFRSCSKIVMSNPRLNRTPYFITNMGLSIELKTISWAMETYLAALDCETADVPNSRIGIFLRLLPDESQYTRVMLDQMDTQTFHFDLVKESLYRKIFVRQKFSGIHPADLMVGLWHRQLPLLMYGFWLRTLPLDLSIYGGSRSISPPKAFPDHQWDSAKRIFTIPVGSRGTTGRLRYHVESLRPNSTFDLEFGFNRDFCPVITLLISGEKIWEQSIPLHLGSKSSLTDRLDADYKAASKLLREHFIQVTTGVLDGQKVWVVDVERLHDGRC